jgi:hypothetical protein
MGVGGGVDNDRWAISVVGSVDDVDARLLGAVNSVNYRK